MAESLEPLAIATVASAEPVKGLAQRYAELDDAADPEDVAGLLREHAMVADLPTPGDRGVPGAFEWIARHLARRQLVDDLGRCETAVEWLVLHVPPGGTASLVSRADQEQTNQISLMVVGAGLGSGHSIKLKSTTTHAERRTCLRVLQELELHLRRYAVPTERGGNSLEVTADIVGVGASICVASDPCPLCGAAAAEVDPFDFEPAGLALDLTEHDSEVRRDVTYELDADDERDIGISPNVIGIGVVKAGFTLRRRIRMGCDVGYVFPSGARYTPLRPVGMTGWLPFWAVDYGRGQRSDP